VCYYTNFIEKNGKDWHGGNHMRNMIYGQETIMVWDAFIKIVFLGPLVG